ncbi:hypothetical protein MAPG_10442 [Magnaporthiopsis poae ATCC 64411]|uniref:Uncharacterized protein n=1 Tax=Magnaporthiopsis poae (strain ATCC 64411 / 73-15) TaxID=644358 RepID=A0A0C4ECL3_MAGP6|nr:hypothetical protein MAPG_10442 [Magnaporthiopsis poae ATCC 64411]
MPVEIVLGKKLDIVAKHDLDRPSVRAYTHVSEFLSTHALFNVYDFKPVDQYEGLDSQLHLLLKHRAADLPIPGAPTILGDDRRPSQANITWSSSGNFVGQSKQRHDGEAGRHV